MLRWAAIILSILHLQRIFNFSLVHKLALHSSTKEILVFNCQWIKLEIDSINAPDNISVPL